MFSRFTERFAGRPAVPDQPALSGPALILLNELVDEDGYNIQFQPWKKRFCEVQHRFKEATICYNPKLVNDESIAHELLHLWLRRFNYSLGNHLFGIAQDKGPLSKIFTRRLCSHIDNCCDHLKMYGEFSAMGYAPSKFLSDGMLEKSSLRIIHQIRLKLLGAYSAHGINQYIGNLISILADHSGNDYSRHHVKLLDKDPELYVIVCRFWNKWVVFDIQNIDVIYNSDFQLTEDLAAGMKAWTADKKVY